MKLAVALLVLLCAGAHAAEEAAKADATNTPRVITVDLPQLRLPELKLPKIDLPKLQTPDGKDVKLPNLLPNLRMQAPTVNVSLPNIPGIEMPKVRGAAGGRGRLLLEGAHSAHPAPPHTLTRTRCRAALASLRLFAFPAQLPGGLDLQGALQNLTRVLTGDQLKAATILAWLKDAGFYQLRNLTEAVRRMRTGPARQLAAGSSRGCMLAADGRAPACTTGRQRRD